MTSSTMKCPLCKKSEAEKLVPGHHTIWLFEHAPCGPFAINDLEARQLLTSNTELQASTPARVGSLLVERRLRSSSTLTALLVLGTEELPNIDGYEAIRILELLPEWPRAFDERLRRAFCNLVRQPGNGFGRDISSHAQKDLFTLFAESEHEHAFIMETLEGAGWITVSGKGDLGWKFRISPAGWRQYDEIVKGIADITNPVFVAMWFGKKGEVNRTAEMTGLYQNTIARASQAAGWRVMRSDSEAHNDFIMGRIVENIRMAPFLIADLTENNNGVYYEAGFARGLGKAVIYCCPEAERPHFDVSGVNQVRYRDHADLLKKLYDRILGTCGTGPHKQKLL